MTITQSKLISVLLLTLLLSIPTNGRTHFTNGRSDNRSQVSSPEEERQARNFAIQVIKRFKVTNDITPLMREFFIKDFVIRVKFFLLDQKVNNQEFAEHGIERQVLVHATLVDYQRAYIAFMNAWDQYHQLQDATDGYVAARNNVEGGDIFDAPYRKLRVTARDEALTPLFFSTAKVSPLLSLLITSMLYGVEEADEAVYNTRLKAATIRTIGAARAFITALTKCVDLMRNAVKKLRVDKDTINVGRIIEAKGEDDSEEIYKFWHDTLEKRAFGLSAGTKLIYARIYPWEILMTRRNGKLKVVAVYPDFDGD